MPITSIFCPGAAAALFYFLAARSKAVLCRHEFGSADTTAAFLNNYFLLCLILAAIEDVGVHQIVSQLLGSAATLRGDLSMPTTFCIFKGPSVPIETTLPSYTFNWVLLRM